MTDEQYNKFLTLLMGECWHEWKEIYLTNGHTVNSNPTLVCKYCDIARVGDDNPDHLANPLVVIRWMEKEMPEVWNLYLVLRLSKWTCNKAWETIDQILDLRNLVTYLVEHPEWGEKEICSDYDRYEKICPPFCNKCDGVTGKVIHPALVYLKSVKEEG